MQTSDDQAVKKQLPIQRIAMGAAVLVAAIAAIWWLGVSDLPEAAIIVPRLSLVLVAVGGLLTLISGLRGTALPPVDKAEAAFSSDRSFLLTVALVLSTLALFGYLIPRLGLAATAFICLTSWWLALARFWPRSLPPLALAILAAAVSAALFLFAIHVLDLYLPDTWLF